MVHPRYALSSPSFARENIGSNSKLGSIMVDIRTWFMLRISFLLFLLCGDFLFILSWRSVRYTGGRRIAKPFSKNHWIYTHDSFLFSASIPSIIEYRSRESLPRFHEDITELVNWIVAHGGEFNAKVVQDADGWSLVSTEPLKKHSTIIRIPKTLCISSLLLSSTSANSIPESKISPNAIAMMNTLSENQWRARLGIALLSEYTRIDHSFYSPYIRNVPFEIRGLPIFFKLEELQLLQNTNVIEETLELCDFLQDYSENALKPLYRSGFDPFSGREVTLNSFGWSFGIAASRAIRPNAIISTDPNSTTSSPVLIPGVDLAQHSFTPTCKLYDTGTHYLLLTSEEIPSANSPLTISYGPMSNDELLVDYGFTVDDNPYDKIIVDVNETIVNTARSVMGQCNVTDHNCVVTSYPVRNYIGDISSLIIDVDETDNFNGKKVDFHSLKFSAREIGIGHRHDSWQENSLTQWQRFWLYALEMCGYKKKAQMIFGANLGRKLSSAYQLIERTKSKLSLTIPFSPLYEDKRTNDVKNNSKKSSNSNVNETFGKVLNEEVAVDPRLWAILRVLYSANENSLSQHGYDPWLVQHPGNMLSLPEEAHIVRTMMGIMAILLNGFQTNIKTDLRLLLSNTQEKNPTWKGVHKNVPFVVNSVEYKEECRNILKSFFEVRDLLLFNSTTDNKETADNSSSSLLPLYMQSKWNLDEKGKQLSHNLQEIYKYRIRKKMMLMKVLWQLCDLYQTIYFTSKREFIRSQGLNESAFFPPLPLSLHSSQQPLPLQTANNENKVIVHPSVAPTTHKKMARDKKRPHWTPQDDEHILQILHLSHILISPFLSSEKIFPSPLFILSADSEEIREDNVENSETRDGRCKRTFEKNAKEKINLHPNKHSHDVASKSASIAEKNALAAAALLRRAAKISEKYKNARIRL